MNTICAQCQTSFEITAAEQEFRQKISPVFNGKQYLIPDPARCPDCREQRRLSFRNERNLYKRPCTLCQKNIVSVYSRDKPFPVYCSDCWFSDRWDPLKFGRPYDFSRPFFQQFEALLNEVPLLSNIVFNCTNCDYNSFIVDSKDCYLCSRIAGSEKILYSYLVHKSRDSIDCYNLFGSEGCYECLDCWNCYNVFFSQLCRDSSDIAYCYDCIGCKNCFGCYGLRHKEYYFCNQPCSREEFERYREQYFSGSFGQNAKLRDKFISDVVAKKPHRDRYLFNAENALGDYITESRNIHLGFDIEKSEDVSFTWGAEFSKDIMDSNFIYFGERCYEQISNSKSSNILFSFAAITGNHDLLYSHVCFNNCGNCFGSASLNHQEYCVLNKRYTKEEYEKLVPKIIEHMQRPAVRSPPQAGEGWGEFFPVALSPFAYHETFAQDYYPLSKEDIISRGWKWKEPEDLEAKGDLIKEIPDRIQDISNDILHKTLICQKSKRPFKITEQELQFYRDHLLPLPRLHPHERLKKRIALRNPRRLWDRNCMKCQKSIKSSYAPERPEIVYCEECYTQEVY